MQEADLSTRRPVGCGRCADQLPSLRTCEFSALGETVGRRADEETRSCPTLGARSGRRHETRATAPPLQLHSQQQL